MNENTKTYPKPSRHNRRAAYRKRRLEDLNVIDDFLMNAAASDPKGGPEFCRLLLSTLLGREIGRVEVSTQKSIPACTPELRGVRLDVEGREETETVLNIYDIEPCLYSSDVENLAKRNRFYQGRIDGRYLTSGERDFSQLPNLYVIMILPFDPFGEDYMMYQFRNKCEEVPDLDYPDGLRYIYFTRAVSQADALARTFGERRELNTPWSVELIPEGRRAAVRPFGRCWTICRKVRKTTL